LWCLFYISRCTIELMEAPSYTIPEGKLLREVHILILYQYTSYFKKALFWPVQFLYSAILL